MNKKLGSIEQHPTTAPTLHSPLCTLYSERRRRNGKIASLPKPHRDLVNQMLEDGVAYKQIVEALSKLGHTVSARNISNWFQGGYQDWLLHQERLAANRIREEAVLDILTNNHDVDLSAAGLQIAATHLCQLLLAAHPETAAPDSSLNNYIRVANSLCHISRQLMKVQEFRDQYPSDPDDHQESDPAHAETEPLSPAELEVQDFQSNPYDSSPSSPTAQPADATSFNVQASTFKVQASTFKVQASEFEVQGSEFVPHQPPIHKSTNPPIPQSINPFNPPLARPRRTR